MDAPTFGSWGALNHPEDVGTGDPSLHFGGALNCTSRTMLALYLCAGVALLLTAAACGGHLPAVGSRHHPVKRANLAPGAPSSSTTTTSTTAASPTATSTSTAAAGSMAKASATASAGSTAKAGTTVPTTVRASKPTVTTTTSSVPVATPLPAPNGAANFKGVYEFAGGNSAADAGNPDLAGVVLTYYWSQIEPQRGAFDWSLITSEMAPWVADGKKVVLRISTSGAASWDPPYSGDGTPSWVYADGTRAVADVGATFPVYWDTAYLTDYSSFVRSFGQQFNGNPNVAFIEAGVGMGGRRFPSPMRRRPGSRHGRPTGTRMRSG